MHLTSVFENLGVKTRLIQNGLRFHRGVVVVHHHDVANDRALRTEIARLKDSARHASP